MSNSSGSILDARMSGLSVRGLSKYYGQIEVLSDFNLDVRQGEIIALLGENGAGKSTVSSIIAGVTPPSAGTMTWCGKPYTPASPGDAITAGIGLIHQEMHLLPELSVAENIFVGRLPVFGGKVDRKKMNRIAGEQLQRLGLDVPLTQPVKFLSVAGQQQVEIAKALCLKSRLLIFDEPTAALGAAETKKLFSQIRRLREDGVSFIYISHRLDEISHIADRVVVLRDGKTVAEHPDAQVSIDILVREMVGREVNRIFPAGGPPRSEVTLEVESLSSSSGDFSDITFSVCAGEIFGVAGIVGAGRTELMRAIAGADAPSKGMVKVCGKQVRLSSPSDAARAGVMLVPEDRKQQGLVLEHTLTDNITVGNFDVFSPSGWVWPKKAEDFAAAAIERVGIKGIPEQNAGELSGGNQQKTVIARRVSRPLKVLILDEPTRGIDVGARAAIYDMIDNLARNGMAIILVSSDLDEVLGLSHRILVLSRGRQRGILQKDEASRESVINLATT